jgi:site-specific recombinase XerD
MNKGVPPQFIQRIAGHSSLNVTRVYTHLEDNNLLAAVNAFGPLLMN